MKKIIIYFTQSLLVYILFFISKIIGLKLSRKLCSFIFIKIGNLFRSKKTIYGNLDLIKSNLSFKEKEMIIKRMWSNYGKTFIEYVFLDKFKKNTTHVSIKNKEILDTVIISKPVIFISGHFANFELMSMEMTKNNINLATIYRPLNNYFLNPFMEFLRRRYICKNQIKKGRAGVREAMKFVNNGYSIALMIDQRVSEGETINLFNKPCLTTTLPAQLALKFNLDIVPVSIIRDIGNNFELTFHSAINTKRFKDKSDLTRHLNSHLETMLKKNPGQWIWTHNRWKL